MTIADWEQLGGVSPSGLRGARIALHSAAGIVSAAGRTLVAPRSDDSHTALTWSGERRLLLGEIVPGERRAALDVEALAIFVADAAGAARGPALPLAGRSDREAVAWLGEALGSNLTHVAYELSLGPVGGPQLFGAGDVETRRELARWYGDAARAIAPFAALEIASPVRIWPHHFDIATLLALGGEGEKARTIGVGLSPGDASYAEPYFYVTPWPHPSPPLEPPVRRGRWHTEGWFGAVLTASSLIGAPPAEQAEAVASFLADAVAAGRALVDR